MRRATVEEVSGDTWTRDFYPRSPCGERRCSCTAHNRRNRFLSTLSLRRATFKNQFIINHNLFLSTLSLRRATLPPLKLIACHNDFYPRSPCGERPKLVETNARKQFISIHALLAESDIGPLIFSVQPRNFYPRSPCGERPTDMAKRFIEFRFLSTLSLRRATPATRRHNKNNVFLSTLSLRRATKSTPAKPFSTSISIHALLAESDVFLLRKITITVDISIHALLAESDPCA